MIKGGIEYLDGIDWSWVEKHQQMQYATLKRVVKICDEYNLRYCLNGGTLLGALRHGGFIPWDDDIDIDLPRPDYEKLIDILRETDGVKTLNWLRDEDYSVPISKVMLWHEGDPVSHSAGAIDIFPVDGSPKWKWVRMLQMKLRVVFFNVPLYRMGLVKGVGKNILMSIVSAILPRDKISLKRLNEKLTIRNKFILTPGRWIGVRCFSDGSNVPCELYGYTNLRKVKFVDGEYNAPEKAEDVLTSIYKNWRALPPLDKRVPKHEDDAAWFYSEMK